MLDVVDPALRARVEGQAGQEIEAIGRRQAERLAFLLDLADKARALLPRVCPGS
jgi:hypothetical protein